MINRIRNNQRNARIFHHLRVSPTAYVNSTRVGNILDFLFRAARRDRDNRWRKK
jgi:hypothetical protein